MTTPETRESVYATQQARANRAAKDAERTPRLFVGKLPTGVPILVRVYADDTAEVAFKHDGRWGLPVTLGEER